jgi:hypothetical protein
MNPLNRGDQVIYSPRFKRRDVRQPDQSAVVISSYATGKVRILCLKEKKQRVVCHQFLKKADE